ncbi:MAG: ATP-dependent DNA helicase RecG [Hyphomicrobiales bacterium]|nr:ATP-dependent DNA helicase RecG [Hyphomicrobiales bacterium]MCA1999878.1 ATP-dependent DNA helicase RecG [Hyphomicrobiales bacterium]
MSLRPSDLDPWFAPVARLPGIGPKLAPLFDHLAGRGGPARILDLLFHLPLAVTDRSLHPTIAAAPMEGIATVQGTVEAHRPAPPGRAKAPHRVILGDETGDVTLVFFRLPQAQIEAMLPLGATRIVSGRMEPFDGLRQMVHPDRILPPAKYDPAEAFEPAYPLTEGLSHRRVNAAARAALARLRPLPEWQDEALLARENWPDFTAALAALHQPRQAIPPEETSAWRRLAYDELLAGQVALRLLRAREQGEAGRAIHGDGRLRRAILAHLPYALTGAQRRAIAEIEADLARPERMLRLLQGDVGAGKTIVAALAMAIAVEGGHQAAMMAPTEILARQHHERLAPLAEAAGIRLGLLTGRAAGGERNATLAALAGGELDIVVGTHALFQNDVVFRDLALAIVDEQHRFGVHQRLALAHKGGSAGPAAHLLVMTATPIPRTLVLSYFGDLDISVLDEKPPGREPVDTRLVNQERLAEMIEGLGRAIAAGSRIYWVCPLVEESEKIDAAAAEARHADLARHFPGRVGLVHGRMAAAEKDEVIARFAAGNLAVLVATTVIEVGVDIPAANVMVIEEAQRFGLAQLHQLRGRVGRGGGQSRAILLYRGPLSETARARLEILRSTEDGFRIAEEDLRLRGEGDVLGTRQSGMPGFRIARLDRHQDLLRIARDDATLLVARDPRLETPRGAAIRRLLYLFERDEAIRLIGAG